MLNSYPFKINNIAIPYPDSWNENPKKLANTFETEAGTMKKVIVRTSKLSISASFTVTSFWLKKFQQFRDMDVITLTKFNAQTGAYSDHTVCIDDESFEYDLIPASRFANNTNGLYKLSFNLEEY